jgi:thiol-disulfide isomerase/thioredoxin
MGRAPLHVTLVTAPECHLCDHARQVLARLAESWPIVVEEFSWHSPEGVALVRGDGVPFPPALYVAGELYGYGRLSEARLRRELARRIP